MYRVSQVGDVLEIVFRNSLPNPVNLVLHGALIPDDDSYTTMPVAPGSTVRRKKGFGTMHLM